MGKRRPARKVTGAPRRIHTRDDKRADIFLSTVLIVAAIIWWAN
jgi:hypothetical protein